MNSFLLRRAYSRLRRRLIKRPLAEKLDFNNSYPRFVKTLLQTHPTDVAMKLAVGGEFEAIGILERELLIQLGLGRDDYIIDVGCGSGRLAHALSDYLTGRYLGIDVVPELIDYARNLIARPAWRFEVAEGLAIPERDGAADMVCFFSVFTHLLHEQSYVYLKEARRVLKPKGKIIFSFLEFAIPSHWEVFESNVADISRGELPLNMFIGRDAVHAWASHLGLKVEHIQDADKPYVQLPHPVTFDDGTVIEGRVRPGKRGQSICILSR